MHAHATSCAARLAPAAALVVASAAAAGGPPGFGYHLVDSGATGCRGVSAADMDLDGDVDFLAAIGNAKQVAWYENLGGLHPTFIKHVVDPNRKMPDFIFAADVNNDGLPDIVSNSTVDDTLVWYQNNGAAAPTFIQHIIDTDPDGWANPVLQGQADAIREMAQGDFNGDGWLDLATASVDDDSVIWWANPGAKGGPWAYAIITEALDGARTITSGDYDGDGDPDIAAGGWYDPDLVWFENDGLGSFTEHVIFTYPPKDWPGEPASLWGMVSDDIDGDGDLDMTVARRFYGCEWFENDGGSPTAFTRHVILAEAPGGKSVDTSDVDEDGDVDIIFASRHDDRVSWFESDGAAPPAFTEHIITIDPDGVGPPQEGPADGARSVVAADFDGDGDNDVGWCSRDNNTIAWHQNSLIDLTPPCTTDLDHDGSTGISDLLLLLSAWASDPGGPPDFDGKGGVGIADLLALIAAWGPCK